jgi:6-phosphogluconolactonase
MQSSISRRWFFSGAAAAAAGGALLAKGAAGPSRSESEQRERPADMPKPSAYFAYVGARTTRERNARGEGINVYRVDALSGRWSHVQLVTGLANPSYLSFDRTRQFLYSVHGDLSDISAYRIDGDTGRLTEINRGNTDGKNPVHLAVDPSNRFMIVANHISSTVVVMARHADGSIGSVVDKITLSGTIGPHRVEQPFPKPHQVEFDRSGRFVVVPDKGLDQVFTFRFDADAGKLRPIDSDAPKSREGAGPRHVVFHPTNMFAYVVNELDSTVVAYRFNSKTGALTAFQVLTTLPDTFVGNSRGSEIAMSADGGVLYASNRGHDSVASFSVDPVNGRLSQQGWESSQGKTPRFFALDPSGRLLFAANEDSDDIVAFKVDGSTGKLAATQDVIKTGSPVCIVFAPAV